MTSILQSSLKQALSAADMAVGVMQLKQTGDAETDVCRQLSAFGFNGEVVHNASPAVLYEHALKMDNGTSITSTGALATISGLKTVSSLLLSISTQLWIRAAHQLISASSKNVPPR